ncbi:YbaK/EbsC family protein [Streptomyces candidus]|uniref:Prolyl-tRNA editing enzyme YbaK/EbsC (Cys-tRNA(Pro) deacylase) n=1 Tax=Streptomyces candidus TaxID=67283 RepID=A0A7X0HDT9_9ACTN|nr:YbaK/EbsC family protein [Streptomyces candidus]MBB6435786.1 prolyl-tRNA editing enzyme YbaK/EbsC (Cys-tRNA(Pro) deacylase) [Streptomyces candidus]
MQTPFDVFEELAPAPGRLDELVAPVAAALRDWRGPVPASEVRYVETDPAVADTAAFVERYGAGLLAASATCVIVAAKRGGETTLAACLIPSAARADVNGAVRRHLGARKVSFAPMDTAVGRTGMEYGGITPIGLPADWPLLVDASLLDLERVLIGSGRRVGKLVVPGKVFAQLPGVDVLPGLAG